MKRKLIEGSAEQMSAFSNSRKKEYCGVGPKYGATFCRHLDKGEWSTAAVTLGMAWPAHTHVTHMQVHLCAQLHIIHGHASGFVLPRSRCVSERHNA